MSRGSGGRRASPTLETRLVRDVRPDPRSPRRIAAEFRALVDAGVPIRPAGPIREAPTSLLSLGFTPRYRIDFLDVVYYLTNLREDQDFRFFVAYVQLNGALYPRIFYKDQSLVWRSPTHCIRSEDENWIGKGALKPQRIDGGVQSQSAEETTDLPLEIQAALDECSHRHGRLLRDEEIVAQVLRNAPDDRYEPYEDFNGPRRRAMANPRNRINGGRLVAWFERENDPASLRFEPGFEPDFDGGLVEESRLRSRMYGGAVRKLRILSGNRRIQYQFVAAPYQVWIIPPQALTTEIMSYGVRTVDVEAHDDLCVPGYEYHFLDDELDPPELYSQIPPGYAGDPAPNDPDRADASPWIEKLPVIQEFRRHLDIPRSRR